jgi:alkylhydroperoxidase family enzyme
MPRIPFPDAKALPSNEGEFLNQVNNLNIFLLWAHSVIRLAWSAQLGAAQFAKLELPRSVREL